MLKIYGSLLCPDCVACCEELNRAGVCYEFLDFADSLKNLKEFLVIREKEELFTAVKENGSIGIPCVVDLDGNISLTWQQYVTQAEA